MEMLNKTQFLSCSCRFTLGQSELSMIIIELHYEQTFTLQVSIQSKGKLTMWLQRASSSSTIHSNPSLQKKWSLQYSSTTVFWHMKIQMFDQGFGDKLPCDISRPGVWWVLTHFILSNRNSGVHHEEVILLLSGLLA